MDSKPVKKQAKPTFEQPSQMGLEQILAESMSVSASFSGPLPTPAHFEGYEKVYPGAAGIIVDMAKKSQEHRHHVELLEVNMEGMARRETLRLQGNGQKWAGGLSVGILLLAFYMVHLGQAGVAGTMIGIALAIYAGAFVFSRSKPEVDDDQDE